MYQVALYAGCKNSWKKKLLILTFPCQKGGLNAIRKKYLRIKATTLFSSSI
jgi:hypothetical protein